VIKAIEVSDNDTSKFTVSADSQGSNSWQDESWESCRKLVGMKQM